MNISLNTVLPSYIVEPTMMFAHPTYLNDPYIAKVEQIYIPEATEPEVPVEIKVSQRETWAFKEFSWKRKIYEAIINGGRKRVTINRADDFVFDARFDTDRNFAHVMEHVCTPVLMAQKAISEHLNQTIKIHVILAKNASKLARDTYETIGIPTICTDDKVFANVVEVSPENGIHFNQPDIFNIEIPDYNPSTPERIFISRRGSRSLINNDEVTQFLEQQGFVTYYFEDLSTSEKWSIARNAKMAVVVHGAGTGNFIFNRTGLADNAPKGSGLQLIELFSPCYTIFTYRRYGTLLNGKWCAVRGQISPDVVRFLDFDKSPRHSEQSPICDPFKIDLESLQMAIDYMDAPQRSRLVHS